MEVNVTIYSTVRVPSVLAYSVLAWFRKLSVTRSAGAERREQADHVSEMALVPIVSHSLFPRNDFCFAATAGSLCRAGVLKL